MNNAPTHDRSDFFFNWPLALGFDDIDDVSTVKLDPESSWEIVERFLRAGVGPIEGWSHMKKKKMQTIINKMLYVSQL